MPETSRPEVEIRTSARRRKTATAFWEHDRIVVVLPSWMPRAHRPEMVEALVRRVLAQQPNRHASDEDLSERAALLARRYLHGTVPRSIRWVTNQQRRWGSCSAHSGEIRISDRLRVVPSWVLDAVLVHELAHLEEASHSARFHELADRYPRMAEADVFLEGFGLGLEHLPTAAPAPEPAPRVPTPTLVPARVAPARPAAVVTPSPVAGTLF